jgi:hypothetical protein
MTPMRTRLPVNGRDDLERHLGAWVGAGLMAEEQAARIRAFEAGHRPARTSGSRLGTVGEAVTYLGVVLALAAMFTLWGQLDEGSGTRLLLTAGATVLLAGVGTVLVRSVDPGFVRIGSVLWLLATGTVAFATIDALLLSGNTPEDVATMAIVGASMAAVGWGGYALRPNAATHVAAFAGTATLAVGVGLWIGDEEPAPAGAALIALAVGWYLAAPRLAAPMVGLGLASLAGVFAPTMFVEASEDVAVLLGVALSAVITVLGSRSAGSVGLAIGGAALFGYTTAAIVRFFGESLGAPLALLIAAVLLLGIVFGLTRLRRPKA